MAELLSRDYDNSVVTVGNKIRRLALNLMLYKGSEYAAVSGAMMVCTFSILNFTCLFCVDPFVLTSFL